MEEVDDSRFLIIPWRNAMPAFIPHFAGTTQPVGLYAAESENLLFHPIDQETSPMNYEYAVVPDDFGIELWTREDLLGFEIGSGDEALMVTLCRTRSIGLTEEFRLALTGGDGVDAALP